MQDRETIIENVRAVRETIALNAMDPENPPLLLPVTKTQPAARILPLRDAGIGEIGENRVQEITEKYGDLSTDFAFHMIGRLQTNKIKYIIGKVCMVHALDRPALAQAIDARAQASGLRVPVLIEVNIGGEAQKAGIAPEEILAFARACAGLGGIEVRGLMAVMPIARDPEQLRPLFKSMRRAFEALRDAAIEGTRIVDLSMGMSSDYVIAAQEGATIVRVGSAIFGQRPPVGINRA